MQSSHLRYAFFLLFSLSYCTLSAQSHTLYATGNLTDVITQPTSGICLMGGATENDNAMRWFLERADGGDVVVLRTSGSDGYNDYFYSDLGVNINSVRTFVFNSRIASSDPTVLTAIENAEAIWFTGGDQWDYISYWRDSPVAEAINTGISERNVVIGGTSAGMAILGSAYFSAENGTVTSATALQNPFDSDVTVDQTPFLTLLYLQNVITDTHYDSPDRRGRQVVFLARLLQQNNAAAYGIACDEYTSVCVDENGIAKVYGGYPEYEDQAYFLQTNCELSDPSPESLQDNQPLHWERAQTAVKVYHLNGTQTGNGSFDLNDWQTASGGDWQHWYVTNGSLQTTTGSAPFCQALSIDTTTETTLQEDLQQKNWTYCEWFNLRGELLQRSFSTDFINFKPLVTGIYFVRFYQERNGRMWVKNVMHIN